MKFILTFITLFLSFSVLSFDHQHKVFDGLLKENVKVISGQSYVNYKNIKKNVSTLDSYLKDLSSVTKKEFKAFSTDQRLAFLINAYNAFTLKIIVMNYPVKSIRDIGNILRSTWKKKFFILLEEKSHLDNIEHNLIRKNFNEPRIHFAVNCASIGCPSLQGEAYVDSKLEALLEKGTVGFLSNRAKNRVENNNLYLSPIFKWYGEDFEKKFGSVENFVAAYLSKDKNTIEKIRTKKISKEWTNYNWNLNE